ncbi:hypothetical protein [Acidovorax sp.]|uniref:hypothetical protein n=1 Tax=Acidovorax sp. TaxID=1872122 RepID=UPI00391FAD35
MEGFLELFVYVLVNYVFLYTGKAVVYVLTLGRWRGECGDNEGRIHGAAGALTFVRDGQRVLTDRSAAFVGGIACIVLGFAWVVVAQ